MRWRRFGQERPQPMQGDVIIAINHICRLMVDICDLSEEQVCDVLELADQSSIGEANRALLFGYILRNKTNFIDNYAITDKIRDTIYHHKSYPDAKWALGSDEINKWEYLLQEIEARDPIQKYRWMFKDFCLESLGINRKDHDLPSLYREQLKIRSNALREIYKIHGINGIYELSQIVGCPYIVGGTYAHICKQKRFQRNIEYR